MKIILASASPRRKELLSDLGLDFSIIVSDKEEYTDKTLPNEIVMDLALKKAMDVCDKISDKGDIALMVGDEKADKVNIDMDAAVKYHKNKSENRDIEYIIISADTVVAYNDIILGKPADKAKAYETLKLLSGNKHQVYTGVCVCIVNASGKRTISNWYEKTDVYMYEITDDEIHSYIETNEPMDKAGSYGIQGRAKRFIKGISGDYYNVVGLPIAGLWNEIKVFL